MADHRISLGDKVKDRVSGFEGIATGRHEYIFGCLQYSVTPAVKEQKDEAKVRAFDDGALDITERNAVQRWPTDASGTPQPSPSGGPDREAPSAER